MVESTRRGSLNESYSYSHTHPHKIHAHMTLGGRLFLNCFSLHLLFGLEGGLFVWGKSSHIRPLPTVSSGTPRKTFPTPVRPKSSPPGTVPGWQTSMCSGAAFRSCSKDWRTETPFCSHLLHRHVAHCLTLSARILADGAGCVDSDAAASISSHERHVKSLMPWKAEQPPTYGCKQRCPTRLLGKKQQS